VSKSPTPRVDLDPNPPSYRTPVPGSRLPRDPRLPSDVKEPLRPDTEERDTERATGQSGEHLVMHDADDDDDTPPDGPLAMRAVLKQLRKFDKGFEEMKGHCRAASENSFATSEAVRHLRLEMQELKKEHNARLVRLELDRLWIPRLVSTAAILVATVAFVLSLLAFQHH
jgi:hypothetical protein